MISVSIPLHITMESTFQSFITLVESVTAESKPSKKVLMVSQYLKTLSIENLHIAVRLLLPRCGRVYNIMNKQLAKILDVEVEDGIDIVEKVIGKMDDKPSSLTLHEVDSFLEVLSGLHAIDPQKSHFKMIQSRCNAKDFKFILYLVQRDLRMGAGISTVLGGLSPNAFKIYKNNSNLKAVIDECFGGTRKDVILPMQPMLAQMCKDLTLPLKRHPGGVYVETKYDGERLQLHKRGDEFFFFSRNLKPVGDGKIGCLKPFISKAFPGYRDLVLDGEIVLMSKNNQPLPFGSLGVHKRTKYSDATVCFCVFDCLYLDGDLKSESLETRKTLLKECLQPIPGRIVLGDYKFTDSNSDIETWVYEAFDNKLEGVVIKPITGKYSPGSRTWYKVKKDYLNNGAMADSLDLIVLGSWMGTGKNINRHSIFLMGSYDSSTNSFVAVTKVHNGLTDDYLNTLQNMNLVKCTSKPDWLIYDGKPDYIAKEPKAQPVWEILGSEFLITNNKISIRFPRVHKIRDDKSWLEATQYSQLKMMLGITETPTKKPGRNGKNNKRKMEIPLDFQ